MTADTASIPKTLGRYRIVRRLGAGGMAEVFLAKSTGAEGIEKVLVVKRILPTFARSAKFIAMFLEEAKIATRLNHPNIVQVYNFEQVRDEFLLAMEFVDGLDLGRLTAAIRRRSMKLPYAAAAFVTMEIAKGLDYAHRRKDERGEPMEIVHRDVSPQNVLLSYDGTVKIADFGIAKARMFTEETGIIKGKFAYMSPEQARGEKVDRRSDVFAVGVLLAELVMGRAMYPGQHGLDVLERVRQGELTAPEKVDPDVPEELAGIVRRATAFDREERYQTARSLSGVLGQYLHMLDEMYDHESLERLIAEVSPRDVTSPDADPSVGRPRSLHTAATLASVMAAGDKEQRERRHVVVLAGRVRADAPDAESQTDAGAARGVGDEAARVLADIAYKADAVLNWPDGAGRKRFRFILGLRRASVHDPLNALRLAMDVLEALQGLSADMLVPLNASIGVSRGVVSTVRDSSGRLLRYEPVGKVVEVAEGLAEDGDPGEILAAGEVYRLARRVFAFDPQASREVAVTSEGQRRGVRTYRLRGARTHEERRAEAREAPDAQSLLGRDEELRAIEASYQESIASARSVVLAITGELGVGKTRLVGSALAGLVPKPRVLHAECAFGTTDVPFAAVSAMIRDACGIADDSTAEEARSQLRKVTEELVSDSERRGVILQGLEPLVAPVQQQSDEEPQPGDVGTADRALRYLWAALCQGGPVITWIDALQWADGPSLELLSRVIQQSYDASLMILLCGRPDSRTERLVSSVPRVDLDELGEEDRRAFIRARVGGAGMPIDVERAIVQRAGGNPFFIMELVEALLDRGVIGLEGEGEARRVVRRSGAPIALPTTLEGLIGARLDELPESERRAIRWLAAVGPGLTSTELSRIAGLPLEAPVESLEQRGLVQKTATGACTFPNAVVRHVAYETTDHDDLIEMHRRIGSYLAASKAAVPPARIARHLERAGDSEEAAKAYLQAGAAARAVYSNRDALRFYARALGLLPPDARDRFWAHEAREQMLRGMGTTRDRRPELAAMRQHAERLGEPGLIALAFNRLARHELDGMRTTGVESLLDRALSAAVESDIAGAEVEALRLSMLLAREQGDSQKALAFGDRALARAGHDRRLLAARGSVLVQRGILLRRMGRLDEAIEANAEAFVIFRRLGIKRNEAHALNSIGVALVSLGEYEDAATVIRASIGLDRETGDRMQLAQKMSNVGQLYAELGDAERALAFLERALDIFRAVEEEGSPVDTLSAVGEILLEFRGDLDRAAERLDEARRLAERSGDLYDRARERIVRASLEKTAGRLDQAAACAREAVDIAGPAGLAGYELLGLATLAEVQAARGEVQEAESLIERVVAAVRQRGVVEREERIQLALARAYRALGRAEAARAAQARAFTVIETRLSQIRDPMLRERYMASPTVLEIRDSKTAQLD